jgi:hypothetical protein
MNKLKNVFNAVRRWYLFKYKYEKHTCSERFRSVGPWKKEEGLDRWRIKKNGDRTCTFCGSMHPEDFKKQVELCLKDVSKCRIECSQKSYKYYVRRPEVMNADDGGIKFYTWHWDSEDVLNLAEAIKRSNDYFHSTVLPEFRKILGLEE